MRPSALPTKRKALHVRKRWPATGVIFAALTFALAPSAFGSAVVLPAACLGHSIPGVGNQNSCGASGSYSVNFNGGVYTSTVSTSPNPAGSVSVSAGSKAEEAAADIDYYIEFSGPTATVPHPRQAVGAAPNF